MLRSSVLAALLFSSVLGCNMLVHTLPAAARQEVYTTASCPNLDVSHVDPSDVASHREDVYVAEGCGMRWRMTCESSHVEICPRHRPCRTELAWTCDNIQPET